MHPKEQLLQDLYEKFGKGDLDGMLALCTDDITFHIPGATPFSGVHNRAGFLGVVGKVMEISGGSFGEKPYAIIANDEHGVALLEHWLTRDGRRIEYRTDHIWQFRGDKCSRWEERPGDEDAFNRAWS